MVRRFDAPLALCLKSGVRFFQLRSRRLRSKIWRNRRSSKGIAPHRRSWADH